MPLHLLQDIVKVKDLSAHLLNLFGWYLFVVLNRDAELILVAFKCILVEQTFDQVLASLLIDRLLHSINYTLLVSSY